MYTILKHANAKKNPVRFDKPRTLFTENSELFVRVLLNYNIMCECSAVDK